MKSFAVLAVTIAFVTAPAFSGSNRAAEPKRGGILTLSTRKDLTTMNPLVRTSSTDKAIRDLMFEPLLMIDTKGNIHPYLAEKWEVSPDGKLYTFHLRKGVKFHNGREMTAADVKFAMDYTMNPRNGAYGLTRLAAVDRVETDGKYTLQVYLKRVNPIFPTYFTEIRAFSVIPMESLKEGIYKPESYPPGTGPFRFIEWQPGQRLVLERFEDYWGDKALVDRLILKPISNSTVRFTALRSGDVDIIERTPYEWVKQVKEKKIEGLRVVEAPYAGFRQLVFNVVDPPFNNKKLRQAVAHAIKKKEILRAAYFGFGQPADQMFPKGHQWYFEGVPAPGYDLKKAKALLEESGYNGETIPITVRQGEDQESEAATLQAQLKRIGMNVKLELFEYGAYTIRQRKGDFAFLFSGASTDPDPQGTYGPEFLCGDPNKRSSNTSGYCDREVDALLKKAEVELDSEKRRELFKEVLTKISEDLPEIPIGFVPRFFTLRDHVRGFTTDNEGQFRYIGGGLDHTWLDTQ